MIKCKYIGKTEFYDKTKYSPMMLVNGQEYNIVYSSGVGKWKYVIYIVNDYGQVINWIPYNVNPFKHYWKFIR